MARDAVVARLDETKSILVKFDAAAAAADDDDDDDDDVLFLFKNETPWLFGVKIAQQKHGNNGIMINIFLVVRVSDIACQCHDISHS